MAGGRRWLEAIRRTVVRSSCKSIAVLDHSYLIQNAPPDEEQEDAGVRGNKKALSLEDLAAVKIQSFFRGHLARRAFRALRSLVKLQAVVRGVCVRRQARIAIHCMQALVQLQVRVRARQLLSRSGDLELSQPR